MSLVSRLATVNASRRRIMIVTAVLGSPHGIKVSVE